MPERKKFTITAFRQATGAKASQKLLDLRKSQEDINLKITNALKGGPKTVPEVAMEVGMAPKTVLWYIMTYFKYNRIVVAGKTDDGYFRYALKESKGR